MTIRFVEDIYSDFLYDCYIANSRLTEEDWFYYGKEEHHIEIPTRDGGVLCPLNSQTLTTYQHWIAGVLQSEVLNKKCYACVPVGVLPPMMETLRKKWDSLAKKNRRVTADTKTKLSLAKKGKPRPSHVKEKIQQTALTQREKYVVEQTEEMLKANRLKSLGKKWYHDPVDLVESYFHEGEQPLGWVKGRLPRGTVNRPLRTM